MAALRELEAGHHVLPLILHASIAISSLQHSTVPLMDYGLVATYRGPKDDTLIADRIFALVDRRRKANAVFAEVGG